MQKKQFPPPAEVETPEPRRRKCSEKRADGEPCGAWATASGKCAGHSHLGVSANPVANANAGNKRRREQAQEKRERAERRALSTKDAVAAAAEDLRAEIVAAFRDALTDGDPRSRVDAAEKLLSRVYGRPTERVEDARPMPEAIAQLAALTAEERLALYAQVTQGKPLRLVSGEE